MEGEPELKKIENVSMYISHVSVCLPAMSV